MNDCHVHVAAIEASALGRPEGHGPFIFQTTGPEKADDFSPKMKMTSMLLDVTKSRANMEISRPEEVLEYIVQCGDESIFVNLRIAV